MCDRRGCVYRAQPCRGGLAVIVFLGVLLFYGWCWGLVWIIDGYREYS